jgi:predicted nucleic acid-binding protein
MAQAFDLVLSPGIIDEVERALVLPKIRKYLREPNEALRWLADVVAVADLVQDTGNVTDVCRVRRTTLCSQRRSKAVQASW